MTNLCLRWYYVQTKEEPWNKQVKNRQSSSNGNFAKTGETLTSLFEQDFAVFSMTNWQLRRMLLRWVLFKQPFQSPLVTWNGFPSPMVMSAPSAGWSEPQRQGLKNGIRQKRYFKTKCLSLLFFITAAFGFFISNRRLLIVGKYSKCTEVLYRPLQFL